MLKCLCLCSDFFWMNSNRLWRWTVGWPSLIHITTTKIYENIYLLCFISTGWVQVLRYHEIITRNPSIFICPRRLSFRQRKKAKLNRENMFSASRSLALPALVCLLIISRALTKLSLHWHLSSTQLNGLGAFCVRKKNANLWKIFHEWDLFKIILIIFVHMIFALRNVFAFLVASLFSVS